jgi:hypothetical protein
MFWIVKKDWAFYLGYLLMLPAMLVYWHATRDRLDTTAVFLTTGWIYVVTLGAILGVEVNESKNRGYSFLATLPLSAAEIVGAKFAAIFVVDVIYLSGAYLVFTGVDVKSGFLSISREWLVLNSAISLTACGAVYWSIFRYGFERAVYLLGAMFALSFIVPIGLNEMAIRGYIGSSSTVFRASGALGAGSLLAAAAIAYVFFYIVSVRTMERRTNE